MTRHRASALLHFFDRSFSNTIYKSDDSLLTHMSSISPFVITDFKILIIGEAQGNMLGSLKTRQPDHNRHQRNEADCIMTMHSLSGPKRAGFWSTMCCFGASIVLASVPMEVFPTTVRSARAPYVRRSQLPHKHHN